MHPFFSILGFSVPGYGLMMAIGVIAAFIVLHYLRKKIAITEDDFYSAVILAMLGGFVGSKLLFWIVEIDTIIQNPHFLLESITAGFVFYGALIGGLLAIYIFVRVKKQKFLAYFDLFVPAVTLAQAFGRIGCFLAGCCYGKEYDGALSVVFPSGVGSAAPAGIPLFPSQLVESAFLFVLSAVLILIFLRQKKLGTTTGWYFILYSIGRFCIEFSRNDYRGAVGPFSTSQFISIILLILGIILLMLVKKGKTDECQRSFPSEPEEDSPVEAETEEQACASEESSDTAANENDSVPEALQDDESKEFVSEEESKS